MTSRLEEAEQLMLEAINEVWTCPDDTPLPKIVAPGLPANVAFMRAAPRLINHLTVELRAAYARLTTAEAVIKALRDHPSHDLPLAVLEALNRHTQVVS